MFVFNLKKAVRKKVRKTYGALNISIWHIDVKFRTSFTAIVYANELCHLAQVPILS